jgi:hypothetical protein
MAKLEWHQVGTRFYETGVSRGVLYPSSGVGVPWNGLVAIDEEVVGGDHEGFYLDGVKYAEVPTKEEFKAQIQAFSAPAEFAACEGQPIIAPGLFATKQQRTPFGLCYRTEVGNDVAGIDHGYKLHLIYNAMVSPITISNKTVSDSIDPNIFQWNIYAVPPLTDLVHNPTAHWIVDSRLVDSGQLVELEDILYGDSSNDPVLPTLDELVDILQAP